MILNVRVKKPPLPKQCTFIRTLNFFIVARGNGVALAAADSLKAAEGEKGYQSSALGQPNPSVATNFLQRTSEFI